jgi:hypothetical protein
MVETNASAVTELQECLDRLCGGLAAAINEVNVIYLSKPNLIVPVQAGDVLSL